MKYRLRGGTFFVLLSNARKGHDERSNRNTVEGKRSNISEPELLLSLARIGYPELEHWSMTQEQQAKDCTLSFKSCEDWGGSRFKLNDTAVKKALNDCIHNNYLSALKKMCEITEGFIDCSSSLKKDELLVKAVVEVLDVDDSIPDEAEFFILENGSSLKKSDILKANEITLQPFLLGIWHYVITNVDNTDGRSTYEEWCPSTGTNTRRKYKAALGENSKRDIKIKYIDLDFFNNEGSAKTSNYEDRMFEKDGVDKQTEAESKETFDGKAKTNSEGNNQFVFNFAQQGDNNMQIGYIENYHKEDEK